MLDLLNAEPSAIDEQAEYIDDLWWLLHHSDEEDLLVMGLTSYFDDSGSDDGSPLVTIGGPVMSQHSIQGVFGSVGQRCSFGNKIEQPLHMSDFCRFREICWTDILGFNRALFSRCS